MKKFCPKYEHQWRTVNTRYGVMTVCTKCNCTPDEAADAELEGLEGERHEKQ